MEKSEYLYHAVKIVYSSMAESTIAIENFMGITLGFNKQALDFIDEFSKYYEDTMKCCEDSQTRDTVLMEHLRRSREKNIKCVLEYIEKNIVDVMRENNRDFQYDVYYHYGEFSDDKSEKNPFVRIIEDLRKKAENIAEEKIREEGSSLVNIDIVWYDEKVLNRLRENNLCLIDIDEDGELGGHLTQKRVSDDISYLSTRAEREELFREILGEQLDAD